MFETLFAQMMASGALELIAVVLAVVYLLLVMRIRLASLLPSDGGVRLEPVA